VTHYWEEGKEEEGRIFYITSFVKWKIQVKGLTESTDMMVY
jgi:hypothetical protein